MSQYTYQKVESGLGHILIERSDGAVFQEDENNSDYQAYLRWLENPDAEEGGTL